MGTRIVVLSPVAACMNGTLRACAPRPCLDRAYSGGLPALVPMPRGRVRLQRKQCRRQPCAGAGHGRAARGRGAPHGHVHVAAAPPRAAVPLKVAAWEAAAAAAEERAEDLLRVRRRALGSRARERQRGAGRARRRSRSGGQRAGAGPPARLAEAAKAAKAARARVTAHGGRLLKRGGAHLVVLLPLLRVAQHLVRLIYVLEL